MEELVRKAREGDADAYQELILSQMQNMYKIAATILRNDEDIADAVADTVLACWEKLRQLREIKFFRTWMTRILINCCRDVYRAKGSDYASEFVEETPQKEDGYEEAEWRQILGCLDEKYRVIIIMYYVEGYKTAEIAEILEIPDATVRTRLVRAREKLAEVYGASSEKRRTV